MSDVVIKMAIDSNTHEMIKEISTKEYRSIQDTYRKIIDDWLAHMYKKIPRSGTIVCPYCRMIWGFDYPDQYVSGRVTALHVTCMSDCEKVPEFSHDFTIYLDEKGNSVLEKDLFSRTQVFFMVEKATGRSPKFSEVLAYLKRTDFQDLALLVVEAGATDFNIKGNKLYATSISDIPSLPKNGALIDGVRCHVGFSDGVHIHRFEKGE